MSMHLPRAWRVLPAATVHCCAPVPLHVYTCTGVKFALLAPRTSTHRPPYPVIAPVGEVPPPPIACRRPIPSRRAPWHLLPAAGQFVATAGQLSTPVWDVESATWPRFSWGQDRSVRPGSGRLSCWASTP